VKIRKFYDGVKNENKLDIQDLTLDQFIEILAALREAGKMELLNELKKQNKTTPVED
jgi:hypothetical protein